MHAEYLRHSRQLDRRYHPQASPPVTLTPGPVEQIVLDHDRVRGVALGGYGEWRWDVEWLAAVCVCVRFCLFGLVCVRVSAFHVWSCVWV